MSRPVEWRCKTLSTILLTLGVGIVPTPLFHPPIMHRQITVAVIVLCLAITPSWLEVTLAVKERPEQAREIQLGVLVWYLVIGALALSTWRMFDARGGD